MDTIIKTQTGTTAYKMNNPRRFNVKLISALGGVFVMFVGFMAMAGHLFAIEVYYNWNHAMGIGMAYNTAICFVVVGVSLLSIAFEKQTS